MMIHSMIDRHKVKEIEEIWSEARTEALMRRLWLNHRENYGPREKRQLPKGMCTEASIKRLSGGHEVVEALFRAARDFKDGDLHWGLTSSDVQDNVRIRQCALSLDKVSQKLSALHTDIGTFIVNCDTSVGLVGRTHLLPAARTSVASRFSPFISAINHFQAIRPQAFYKELGGPVGRGNFVATSPNPDERETKYVYRQVYTNQTTCGATYLEHAAWLAHVATVVYKLSQDVRLMIALGEMDVTSKVGSSSMPHKSNPTSMERAASLALRQAHFYPQIWNAIATSALERTLTDSALLRNVLPDMYHNSCRSILDMIEGIRNVSMNYAVCKANLRKHAKELNSEEELLKLSEDRPRLQAWVEMRKERGLIK